jgi:hypothetical protein
MKTAKIIICDVKNPDGFGELIQKLGLSRAAVAAHFQWSEYASFELEIDENLQVVAGRVLSVKPPR